MFSFCLLSAIALALPQTGYTGYGAVSPVPAPRLVTSCNGPIVTVQPGDTTWNLVNTYAPGKPMDKVIAANPQLSNVAMIFPGDQLCIPACEVPCSGTLYAFQNGDTVFNLITTGPFQGLTLEAVKSANPQIKDLGFIVVGQQVCFPPSMAAVAAASL